MKTLADELREVCIKYTKQKEDEIKSTFNKIIDSLKEAAYSKGEISITLEISEKIINKLAVLLDSEGYKIEYFTNVYFEDKEEMKKIIISPKYMISPVLDSYNTKGFVLTRVNPDPKTGIMKQRLFLK